MDPCHTEETEGEIPGLGKAQRRRAGRGWWEGTGGWGKGRSGPRGAASPGPVPRRPHDGAGGGRGAAGTGPAACAAQLPPPPCRVRRVGRGRGGSPGSLSRLHRRCRARGSLPVLGGGCGGGREIANEISVNCSLLQV